MCHLTLTLRSPPFLSLVHRTKDPSAGYHANSIEKVFGMARSMVLLIAKVCYTLFLISFAYPQRQVSSFLCRGIRERAVISEVGPNEEEASLLHFGNADVPNDSIMDFDFDKWLNDIGAANTPGAATLLSPAPAPALSNQDLSAMAALPVLDEALLAPPTAIIQPPGTFITDDLANVNVPFGVVMGAGPSAGTFGFVGGAAGARGSSGVGFAAAPDSRLPALKAFFEDAKALFAEVEGWQDLVPLENRDARVLAGNRTHQLAMQVCRRPFRLPSTYQVCRSSSSAISSTSPGSIRACRSLLRAFSNSASSAPNRAWVSSG